MREISVNSILKKLNSLDKKHKSNNRGMTMVEVLMGFVVLMVFLGGMSSIITFSSSMLYNSIDIRRAQEQLQREVYKRNPIAQNVDGTYELVEIDDEGKEVTSGDKIAINTQLIKIESEAIGIDKDILKVRIYGFK